MTGRVLGVNNGTKQYWSPFIWNTSYIYTAFNSGYKACYYTKVGEINFGTVYKAKINYMDEGYAFWDEVPIFKFDTSILFEFDYSLYMFGENNLGNFKSGLIGRIYYCKICEGNTIIRDLIPVIRKSDGEVCMYDKVSEKYFENQGTGEFLYK